MIVSPLNMGDIPGLARSIVIISFFLCFLCVYKLMIKLIILVMEKILQVLAKMAEIIIDYELSLLKRFFPLVRINQLHIRLLNSDLKQEIKSSNTCSTHSRQSLINYRPHPPGRDNS